MKNHWLLAFAIFVLNSPMVLEASLIGALESLLDQSCLTIFALPTKAHYKVWNNEDFLGPHGTFFNTKAPLFYRLWTHCCRQQQSPDFYSLMFLYWSTLTWTRSENFGHALTSSVTQSRQIGNSTVPKRQVEHPWTNKIITYGHTMVFYRKCSLTNHCLRQEMPDTWYWCPRTQPQDHNLFCSRQLLTWVSQSQEIYTTLWVAHPKRNSEWQL